MFSWIPLLGPIIQGVSSIFTGFTSLAATKLQTASATTIAETQASVQIIHDTNDDIGIRIWRDIALAMPVTWGTLIGWDTIIGARKSNGALWHPWANDWMFHVGDYPAAVSYLPYVAYAFLFGVIGFNVWKRK